MHIFITGIAGFLGSNLADYYLNKGFTVSGNDTLIGGSLDNVHKDVNFYKYDCEDLDLNCKYFEGVDVVIHAAAFAHEGLSVFSPYLITKNIFSGSVSVFTAAIKRKVKRIVYCSSMARYGHIKQPYHETDIPNPVDPYGIAKLAAEKVLENLSTTHGIEYNIAIPHNIIGPRQKYDDPFRNVASIMINMMLQNKRPIIYGDGEQTRSFSDVEDCIYCIDKLALDKNIKSQIFNIGPDENYITINQLYETISNLLKFNQKPQYFPERPNEVKLSNCSAEKARKLLNYNTQYNVENSLDKMISYIKEKGAKNFEYNYEIEINNELTPKTWANKLF
jgi:UDP-glucose 4-epimerase|tara:strand:+ start:969 stop:1970 length:1002 start_codon:yes stop_codon:yes gene_type:complete